MPKGIWVSQEQWYCPQCGALNNLIHDVCQVCKLTVRPEPTRPVEAVGSGTVHYHEEHSPSDVER